MNFLKHCLLPVGLLLLIYACHPEKDQQKPEYLQAAIDSVIRARHETGRFDGSVIVALKGQLIYHEAWGLANRIREVPVFMDTRFDIASLNKSFQAALIMLAVEEGRLNLTEKLVHLLDDYSLTYRGNFDPEITLHHMLTHTAGLPDYNGVADSLSADGFRLFKRMHMSNQEYVDFISRVPPVSRPGEGFHYSNFGYHLLAIILENTYSMSFNQLLQQKICEPLEMDGTFSEIDNDKIHDKVASAYSFNDADSSWKENEFIDLSLGRRIFSNTPDLFKWAEAMNDNRLLSDSSLRKMLSNHLEGDISYGYGWVVFDGMHDYKMGALDLDKKYIIHGGSTEGYRSMLVNIERGECVIVFLANTGYRTQELELTRELIKLIYP